MTVDTEDSMYVHNLSLLDLLPLAHAVGRRQSPKLSCHRHRHGSDAARPRPAAVRARASSGRPMPWRRAPHSEPPRGQSAASPRSDSLYAGRSEEHTSELQSLMRISYAVFCLKKKKITPK